MVHAWLYERGGRILDAPRGKGSLAAAVAYDRQIRDREFERLFDEHAQPLFRFLLYRTGDRELSEDLVADTFERAFRSRARFDARRSSPKTWLYSIALNRLRDHARRRGAESRALARMADPPAPADETVLEEVGIRDELRRALQQLSEEEREAIALRFGADLTLPEITRVTGQRLTTIEGRVYGGLRKLRCALR
jgi:RNA polymerase sigma-70 factor (ECF subfamily)